MLPPQDRASAGHTRSGRHKKSMLNVWRMVTATGRHAATVVRSPWIPTFPQVFVHAAWESKSALTLPSHPGYWPAKKRHNAKAAMVLCDAICRDEVLDALHDVAVTASSEVPI